MQESIEDFFFNVIFVYSKIIISKLGLFHGKHLAP